MQDFHPLESDRAPDGIQPLVAWRVWRVVDTRNDDQFNYLRPAARFAYPEVGDHCLAALSATSLWEPLVAFPSICEKALHGFRAPREGCTCGYWAVNDLHLMRDLLMSLARWRANRNPWFYIAVGQVKLWGKVVVTELGYRAEYAYPASINLLGMPRDQVESVRQVATELVGYGVPVRVRPLRHVLQHDFDPEL